MIVVSEETTGRVQQCSSKLRYVEVLAQRMHDIISWYYRDVFDLFCGGYVARRVLLLFLVCNLMLVQVGFPHDRAISGEREHPILLSYHNRIGALLV